MPLRDHFRSPVNDRHSWDSFRGMWPAMIVQQLFNIAPTEYVSAPNVHFGKDFEIDVTACETDEPPADSAPAGAGSGIALAPSPTLTLETDLSDQDDFEVRAYDAERGLQLVAAIEIVSPRTRIAPRTDGRLPQRSQRCCKRTCASR